MLAFLGSKGGLVIIAGGLLSVILAIVRRYLLAGTEATADTRLAVDKERIKSLDNQGVADDLAKRIGKK